LGVSLNAQVAHLSLVLLGRGLNVFESQQVVTSWRTEGHKKLMLQFCPNIFFKAALGCEFTIQMGTDCWVMVLVAGVNQHSLVFVPIRC